MEAAVGSAESMKAEHAGLRKLEAVVGSSMGGMRGDAGVSVGLGGAWASPVSQQDLVLRAEGGAMCCVVAGSIEHGNTEASAASNPSLSLAQEDQEMASPCHAWLSEGMDPNSSYLLEIRLLGNKKKTRKEFSCYRFEKVVDSDLVNFKDFVDSVVDQFPPGYMEDVHVHYYDDILRTFPICKDYGHHWHKCKKGDPDDIAAMMAARGPPKKKRRSTKPSIETSIVSLEDQTPAPCMRFPPRSKSICALNQPEVLPIKYLEHASNLEEQTTTSTIEARGKGTDKANKLQQVHPNSPAMGTRSKKAKLSSPAMSTRSKRRLSL